MKKCVIAPDSFKGSMTSIEVCQIIKQKVAEFFPGCQTVCLPIADGGEGTVDCFLQAMQGEKIMVPVHGPHMEDITGFYGRFQDTAIIEMAAAAGLTLAEGKLNPAVTTTYGVGELMLHAIQHGAKQIILGIGGSCTNDAGCGCAAALGAKFYHGAQTFLPTGKNLGQITKIDLSELKSLLNGVSIFTMCDVTNPLYGPNGAAMVYAPQKGATPEMVKLLNEQLIQFDHILQTQLGYSVAALPGAGAAGGFGAGAVAFLQAKLQSGIDTVLELTKFEKQIQFADLVITGEGKLDQQSLQGKVISGIAKRTFPYHIPTVAIVGDIGEDIASIYQMGISAVFSINQVAIPFSESKKRSKQDLARTTENILRFLKVFH
ncbi:glycerate kinase [Massilioclostridium coli]|uniref:glycerate kinase family protein n=1 Tax=Massilioclostridium coli TaxID=1870991 RepID=UPI0022E8912E|nr:glycerate kinase [Massilioclostridium coli]